MSRTRRSSDLLYVTWFLSFLAVLESLGLKIAWLLIRVEDADKSTNFGLPKLAIDLISTAWMAGMMNRGYNFRVEILLVVSLAEILLVV